MIQLEVHSESTAELRRGSQARVGMLPAVDKGPPHSKIIIGTGLDMTDLMSSGPGGRGPEANNNFSEETRNLQLNFCVLALSATAPFGVIHCDTALH